MKNNICPTKIVFGENYMMEQTTPIYSYNTIKAFGENCMTEEQDIRRKFINKEITAYEYEDYRAKKKGFKDAHEYRNRLAQEKGFNNNAQRIRDYMKKWGFNSYKEYHDYLSQKKGFKNKAEESRERDHAKGISHNYFENKECADYLGVHIAERILSKVFENVQRMPKANPGYDFVCNKGYKIDVKSSTIMKDGMWCFGICNNKIADYFLLLAFDNRNDLNPMHMWLIKGNEVINTHCGSRKLNERKNFSFKPNKGTFDLIKKYELNDKLDKVVACCNTLKEGNNEI